ncbi:MAG: hypothetical protein BMS9Abin20_0289 [Acidimicrobiia bacterium]|nr:MAG: hypothetical protein BMS9Abin20_0289 [Acidimicrobiia bacterium]
MREIRSTAHYLLILAVSGGVLFILGGILTTMSHSTRIILIGAGATFALLGMYTLIISGQKVKMAENRSALESEIRERRLADDALRTRMTYTLRDPLTSIVGFADRMVDDPDMPFDERRELLVAIRDDAREVESVLASLAPVRAVDWTGTLIEGVVLLDEEVRSVASTVRTDTSFESDLGPARAWGDSAQVRQVLRTLINAVVEGGCAYVTLRTEQRAESAVASISGRDNLLPVEAVAALTGNTEASDVTNDSYLALKAAHQLAAEMGGSIGYAQAFGLSHIVVEFPAAPNDLGVQPPREMTRDPFEVSFSTAVDLRPERPTTSIRFA